jgi:hypothetical protein
LTWVFWNAGHGLQFHFDSQSGLILDRAAATLGLAAEETRRENHREPNTQGRIQSTAIVQGQNPGFFRVGDHGRLAAVGDPDRPAVATERFIFQSGFNVARRRRIRDSLCRE